MDLQITSYKNPFKPGDRDVQQLAIIPGATHYNLMLTATPSVTGHARAFLARQLPRS